MATKDVSDLLSDLPIGRFHVLHFFRQMVTWICLAIAEECTGYTFPGLHKDFHLDDARLSYFAIAMQFGYLLGTMLSVCLLDQMGRRKICIMMSPICVFFAALMTQAQSYWQLVLLRTFLCVACCIFLLAGNTWYAEFLPTKGRGALLAAISFGWPLGRGLVIITASVYSDQWRPLMFLVMLAMIVLMLSCCAMMESPRFLVVQGDEHGARAVLERMYAINGTPFSKDVCLSMDSTPKDNQGGQYYYFIKQRLSLVFTSNLKRLIVFVFALFSLLSVSSVLIDTWGPIAYARLLSPSTLLSSDMAPTPSLLSIGSLKPPTVLLPHKTLMLFNVADIVGVALSIFITDVIGRRGCFYIGYFVQGTALMLAAFAHGHTTLVVALGFLGTMCRCFGWEGAVMWTLEAFPTEVRATAFSLAHVCLRAMSLISVNLSGIFMQGASGEEILLSFACPLLLGGCLACFVPLETANKAMTDSCKEERTPLKASQYAVFRKREYFKQLAPTNKADSGKKEESHESDLLRKREF
eukprot:gnl/MRDRNA2_/MRDRNA2_78721_c0_seq2.p1 gnl/MRDRNA2_/MRDRNA2_78721_c0~~gnl/MRDRNA2_/MRDRNA2_78721_c0_seq2.p1  ORF type:complete len:544 (+),score=53.97 gnl/MRDRNA2_/MRDRNA2_78721_c0_seq2:63-1634(+)